MLQISTNADPIHVKMTVAVEMLPMASLVCAPRVTREPRAVLVRVSVNAKIHIESTYLNVVYIYI